MQLHTCLLESQVVKATLPDASALNFPASGLSKHPGGLNLHPCSLRAQHSFERRLNERVADTAMFATLHGASALLLNQYDVAELAAVQPSATLMLGPELLQSFLCSSPKSAGMTFF